MKRKHIRRWVAVGTVLGLLAGCTPAANDGGGQASTSGAGSQPSSGSTSAASEFPDLQPLNVSDFKTNPQVSDFIPDDCNVSGTKTDGAKWKIAWCNADESDESMKYMSDVHRELEQKYGFEMIYFDAQSDPQKQSDHINNAITQGCDAIIVNPVDASALSIPMKKARDAGLVVINCQNVVNDAEAYDCYVGPDDVAGGQLAASMVMDEFPDGAKIVMIDGMMGSTAQINRTKGFRGVLQSHPEYEILEEQTANWSTNEAMNVMESYLSKYPKIDAVFSHFDLATLAAIQSAQAFNRDSEIKFFSVDGTQGADRKSVV